MSDPARPDLTARTPPRAADDRPDPADPAPAPEGRQAPSGPPAKHRPMVAIDTGLATYAIQYRLTEAERDQLLRMQEARGDRRGIDTMRWFLANFADKAIDRARRETEAQRHHYR